MNNEMNTNEVVENEVNETSEAPVAATKGKLSEEEKAKREATRKANEEKLRTVWPEAKVLFMKNMGLGDMEMPAELEALSQVELRKIARDILKPVGGVSRGMPKAQRDAMRLEQQLIKSYEFATRNNLMAPSKNEDGTEGDSTFVALLTKVFINGDCSGKIEKEKPEGAEGETPVEANDATSADF